MKRIFAILCVLCLSACAYESPSAVRPYLEGPTYYKQPACYSYQAYPNSIKRYNANLGINEIYRTYEPTHKVICNYSPAYAPQTMQSLQQLYGHM